MGPFTVHRGNGRRPEGERNGSRAGRPRCNPLPAKTRSSVHAGDCPHCGLKVQWRRLRQRGQAGSQSVATGDTNRRRGCRKATHGTRAGSQGARRGSQGGSTRASRAGWYRPRVADEAPAYPSHPRGISLRGGRRVCVANDKWGTRPELVEGRPRTPSVVRRGSPRNWGKKARAFFCSGVAEPYSAGVVLTGAVRLSGKAKNNAPTTRQQRKRYEPPEADAYPWRARRVRCSVRHARTSPELSHQARHIDRSLARRRLIRPCLARVRRGGAEASWPAAHHREPARRFGHAWPGADGGDRQARRLHARRRCRSRSSACPT